MTFALASMIVVMATWLWINQHPFENLRVATVDLRLISPTRGQIPGPETATVRKATDGFRIVLPVGSEGHYEMAILGPDEKSTPLLHSSGSTKLEGHDVVLDLPANLTHLKSAKYLLTLRRDGYEWEYYSLTLE